MKKSLFFLLMAFSAICFVTTSCSNNSDEVNDGVLGNTPRLMKEAPTSLMAKKDLPDWLAEKVTNLEKDVPPMSVYKVYQCKWKSQTVYNIYNNFSSCILCDTYYADGSRIEWEKAADAEDFCDKSTDWKCIYVIEGSH